MKKSLASLPSELRALWFACGCFDIREKDFKKNFRTTIARAASGKNSSDELRQKVDTVLRNRLFERFRVAGIAHSSTANDFADNVTATLLSVYGRLLPWLDLGETSQTDAMWILIEHVFVPTLYVHLIKFRGLGTGTEFHPRDFWYLPRKEADKTVKPFPRVLDYWRRAARLNSSHAATRFFNNQSIRRRIDRLMTGDVLPMMPEWLGIVDKTKSRIEWLNGLEEWKARFILAFAAQTACDCVDEFFDKGKDVLPSLKLGDALHKMQDEQILADSDGLLLQSDTFFASRLLQRRLQESGELKEILKVVPTRMGGSFGPETSDEEIETYRKLMERKMNHGNVVAQLLLEQARRAGRIQAGDRSVNAYIRFQEYLFDCGVQELNRLLATKRKKGGKR